MSYFKSFIDISLVRDASALRRTISVRVKGPIYVIISCLKIPVKDYAKLLADYFLSWSCTHQLCKFLWDECEMLTHSFLQLLYTPPCKLHTVDLNYTHIIMSSCSLSKKIIPFLCVYAISNILKWENFHFHFDIPLSDRCAFVHCSLSQMSRELTESICRDVRCHCEDIEIPLWR